MHYKNVQMQYIIKEETYKIQTNRIKEKLQESIFES